MTVPTGRPRRIRITAALSVGVLLASTPAVAAPFPDVDEQGSPHAEAIAELSERRIIEGKADGRFDPAGTLTRGQLASIIARAAGLTPIAEQRFSDVSDGPHLGNIAAAADAGFVLGYPDGTFRPSQPIARDQIAALLYRWLEPDTVTQDAFSDLSNTVHAEAINSLAAIGVAQGSTDGTFRPRADLRRDQAASFVYRAVEFRDDGGPGGPEEHPWDAVGRDALVTDDPGGASSGVEYHGTIVHPDLDDFEDPVLTDPGQGTAAVNPVRYDDGDTLVATGRYGMRIYDIRDRFAPKLIGELDRTELALPGDDPGNTYHTAESLNIDKDRKLAILSRDPRAFSQPQGTGISGFYLIDIWDPTAPELLAFQEVGTGHTTTCVNDCQQVWSGGPARAAIDPADWIARPIKVSDLSGVERHDDGSITGLDTVMTYPEAIDTGRTRGITDYSHDVQVDQAGVAWVSGRGGMRGYWTEGIHWDPTQDRYRTARAHDPVPYAGGEVGEYTAPDDPDNPGDPNDPRMAGAIHNAERPVDGADGDFAWTDSERPRRPDANDGADLSDGTYAPGELLYVTDENFTADSCSTFGKFYIVSLEGADEGQAWRTAEEYEAGAEPFELTEISRWSVADAEGILPDPEPDSDDPQVGCSAHYFQMQDGIVAGGWYGQGFRFLDVTDPTEPIQTAYFRPEGVNGWSTHWMGDVIYANDSANGIHILTLDDAAASASATRTEVLAPPMDDEAIAAARRTTAQLVADGVYGWSCAIPVADV